ncbi:MAG: hypothetical protein ACFFCO_09845 [Promethearchaeota archaeon]
MSKPSDQIGGYFQKKAAYLEELADHHASIGEAEKAKELYAQARALYTRLGDKDQIARVEEKLGQLA